MNKRISLLLMTVILTGLFIEANAQGQKNVAKMSLFRVMTHKDVDLGYERTLTSWMTLSLSSSFKIPMPPPKQLSTVFPETQEIKDDSGGVIGTYTIAGGSLRGFTFTPELRFYTSKENEAPEGFYIAPYVKYAKHKIGWVANLDYINPATPTSTMGIDFSLTEFGGGFQLGYQWIIGKGFTIDWYFLGPRVSKFTLGILMKGDLGDPTVYDDMEGEVSEMFSSMPLIGGNVTTSTTTTSLELKAPFLAPNIRSGIALGWAF